MPKPQMTLPLSDRVARSAAGRFRHVLLLAIVVLLWLSLQQAPTTWVGRLVWLADVAAFLVWQPLVRVDRRLEWSSVLMIFAALSLVVTVLDWGWLAFWTLFLAAMVGGKVLVAPRRRERWFYLLVFLELAVVLLLWISPKLIPVSGLVDHPIIAWVDAIAAGVIVLAVVIVPTADDRAEREVFDFLTGFFVLLLLAVLLLGTSALMLFKQTGYFEALTLVMFATAALLLLVSWWAAPRQGRGGVESLLTAYLLRVGFPFEVWLQSLMQIVERQPDARVFLDDAVSVFARIPWVVGGQCTRDGASFRFGDRGAGVTRFVHRDTTLELYTQHTWSASLILQASLIFRLIVELAEAKRREAALLEMRYLRSVHEAGARVTHDIKNILQSLDNLCFTAAADVGASDDAAVRRALARQLPQLSARLKATLEKLRAPARGDARMLPASVWWRDLRGRFADSRVQFNDPGELAVTVDTGLFDQVADNLIINAMEKQAFGRCRRISVGLQASAEAATLSVEDDGAKIDSETCALLFSAVAPSRTGLGIGLLQSARQAARSGYHLQLANNVDGCVRFTLVPAAIGRSPDGPSDGAP